ncbi:hypothetical protein BGZ47_008826 [Haplosporangium gracile]|nr:hypothetical protein BGZ47_008826 [Haplosporangium gracile]
MNENDTASEAIEEGGETVQNDSTSPARAPKNLKYHHKKVQSKAIVDSWIYPSPSRDEQANTVASNVAPELSSMSSLPSKFRVRCSPEMREWYSQEQKRDDLSDCLLQAVAWFEWKGRAVQEAVERSMPRSGSVGSVEEAALQPTPRKMRSSRKPPSPLVK